MGVGVDSGGVVGRIRAIGEAVTSSGFGILSGKFVGAMYNVGVAAGEQPPKIQNEIRLNTIGIGSDWRKILVSPKVRSGRDLPRPAREDYSSAATVRAVSSAPTAPISRGRTTSPLSAFWRMTFSISVRSSGLRRI